LSLVAWEQWLPGNPRLSGNPIPQRLTAQASRPKGSDIARFGLIDRGVVGPTRARLLAGQA
jgi:hypothetical protein